MQKPVAGLFLTVILALEIPCVAAPAEERRFQSVVEGNLAPGETQVYTLTARAGVLISGTFEMKGAEDSVPVTIGLYDQSGSIVKAEVLWASPLPIGFVVPKDGAYRIRIAAKGLGGGFYTLRTASQTAAEGMVGAAGVAPMVRFESARVAQLAKEVRQRKSDAVKRFWAETERHTPLIEAIEGNDSEILVTFLWKAVYETHNVLVDWPGAALDHQTYYMSHLGGTNVWYETVRVRRGSRFSYALAPNNRPDSGRNLLTEQRDPMNPRLGDFGESSILETPGAPDESWYRRTPSVRGKITQHRLESSLLRVERNISIYTPPGYSPSTGPYAVLILFDGDSYLAPPAVGPNDAVGLGAINTLDNLIAARRIRPTVVCFVSDARGKLAKDRATYESAMATELVPWLRLSYAVSRDPKDVVIGGYSAGGGAGAAIALHFPEVFGNVLLQSSAGGGPASLADAAPIATVRFYMDTGLYENGISAIQDFRDLLRAKGYAVTYHETGGAHEFTHWAATLAEGLVDLLGQAR